MADVCPLKRSSSIASFLADCSAKDLDWVNLATTTCRKARIDLRVPRMAYWSMTTDKRAESRSPQPYVILPHNGIIL